MINVSRVLSSKNFNQAFTVYRKKGHWDKGAIVQAEDTLTFQGVISVASPKEILQVPEGDRVSGIMVFYSSSEIYTTRAWGTEYQADYGTSDELVWRGERYKVVHVAPYGDYGYYKAFATYMEGT
jgi:hypothetical protein